MADSRLLNADCNDMKRFLFIMAAMVLAVLSGCEEKPIDTPEESVLNVPYGSKSLEASKGTFVLNVESNVEWSISSSAEWLTTNASEFSGSAGVLCSYTANNSTKSRTAKLTIAPKKVGAAATHSLLVTQSGSNSGNTGGGNDDGNDDGGNDDGGNDEGGNDDGGNDDGGNDDGGNDDGGNDDGGMVTNSGAKYAGWAELPAEENNSDYYYAYHMIPDKGNGKVRNFAVCYSEDLGCPVWVASPMHSYYTAKNTSRSDAYGPDPEIPTSIQVHKRSGYTRGHLLGSSDRLVSRGANVQAFYYSNIAPQLSSGFNTGGGVWNNLEAYCDGQLCADTLYMVNGCYWENKRTTSSGTVIPTHYYKVLLRTKSGNTGKWVVNCSESELKCVVFMVEHNSDQHRVEPHRGMMMSVAELEEMTGHTFFPNVKNAPKNSYNPSEWGL